MCLYKCVSMKTHTDSDVKDVLISDSSPHVAEMNCVFVGVGWVCEDLVMEGSRLFESQCD